MTKVIFKVEALLKESGLSITSKKYEVLKENDDTIVLDNDNFDSVTKSKNNKSGRDYLNSPRIRIYSARGEAEFIGYFEGEDNGLREVRSLVDEYINKKLEYYAKMQKQVNEG